MKIRGMIVECMMRFMSVQAKCLGEVMINTDDYVLSSEHFQCVGFVAFNYR